MTILTVALYCIASAALLYVVAYSAGEPPYGTNPAFWRRVIRHWRNKRGAR